jgi:hypothetical protein
VTCGSGQVRDAPRSGRITARPNNFGAPAAACITLRFFKLAEAREGRYEYVRVALPTLTKALAFMAADLSTNAPVYVTKNNFNRQLRYADLCGVTVERDRLGREAGIRTTQPD